MGKVLVTAPATSKHDHRSRRTVIRIEARVSAIQQTDHRPRRLWSDGYVYPSDVVVLERKFASPL